MTETATTKSDQVRAHYDGAADHMPDFTVMNYGFSDAAEDTVLSPDEPEFYCLRLYEHTVQGAGVQGADVLEVSCGRGGGAAFVANAFAPKRYLGVDLSEANVRIASERLGSANLAFAVGNAQALDLPDASFDVVINIEASHLYDDRQAFFREVARVLRPGGRFCYTDGCWTGDDSTSELLAAGFELVKRRDITDNVMQALRLDSARREAIVDAMPRTDLRDTYKDWSGVVGYRAFQRFVNGETQYFSHLLTRRASAG